MRTRALRRALTTLLAASAVTVMVPATATPASAAPAECHQPRDGSTAQLEAWQRLEPGDRLLDKVSTTELVMQADGNLVLYALGNPGGYKLPLWSSGTYGNPGAYATMQEDGNFVVYKKGGSSQTGGALWHTGTYGIWYGRPVVYLIKGQIRLDGPRNGQGWSSGTSEQQNLLCSDMATGGDIWTRGNWAQSASVWLVFQQDQNLVMYRKSDGKAIWSSGTYGSDQRLYLEMGARYAGNLTITVEGHPFTTVWRTGTAFNEDAYALLQDDGNFVIYKTDGGPGKGGALWASGTYNKV